MIRSTMLLLSLLLLAGCTGSDADQAILGTLERERLELIAESNERIAERLVSEGEFVAAGQLLLRQEPGEMTARLDQARAAVTEAQSRVAELVNGPRRQEIVEARAILASARSTSTTAAREYDRVQDLVERKLLSQSSLDQARAAKDEAAGAERQAYARLELLLEGTRIETLDQARAALDAARGRLAELEISAERYSVRAPRPGLIEALPYETGERPATGAPVVVMLAEGSPYARVYVPEPLRVRALAGTKVRVEVDGINEPLDGTIRYVSAQAAFTPYYALTQEDRSRLAYLAEIDLTGPAADALPAGIPVQVYLPGSEP